MNKIIKHPARDHGYSLTGPSYLPTSEEEHALREVLQLHLAQYRAIKSNEIETLIQNGNLCDDWGEVLVTERFNPRLVVGCQFHGRVRIGNLENFILELDGQKFPVGLYHSRFISCDLGDNVSIDRVSYLAHFILGEHVILQNVGRMLTRRTARFGHGVLKQGENESQRRWIDVSNENGGRGVLAFDGMTPGDAWLWSRYRAEPELMKRFQEMTDRSFDPRPGYFGTIGDRTLIRNTQAIVDSAIGTDAWIDGALRLENLTIRSETRAATRIGDGAMLSDGIVGFGCRIESAARAERFVLGENVKLQQGARVAHSVIGDNSTIAGCEVSNNLIFCNHEQHHSSSFLIATTLLGQNNIAAGAVIGSNHTSRVPDGEIYAGRGFWPGLCVSLKHNTRLASYTLLAKGDYQAELNLPLPFSLVSNSADGGSLQVMPAYWFEHNLYALKRNEWKYAVRDQRVRKDQNLVFEALAPDTVEEIFEALALLEKWVKAAALEGGSDSDARTLLETGEADALEVLGEAMENSRRPVRIVKAARAWNAYRAMAQHYAVSTLLETMEAQRLARVEDLLAELGPVQRGSWVNLGGQLIELGELEELKQRILAGEFSHWADLHAALGVLWEGYPPARARHALATLLELTEVEAEQLPGTLWLESLQGALKTQQRIAEGVRAARAKDFEQPFRRMIYGDVDELTAVLGSLDRDPLIQHIDDQTAVLTARVTMQLEQTNVTLPRGN